MLENQSDPLYERIRLVAQLILSLFVLTGVGIIILTPGTSVEADSGAAAVSTLVVTYWFGSRFGLK